MSTQKSTGILYALAAFGLWGFLPIYFKQIEFLSSIEILLHRIIWSVFFVGLLLLMLGNAKSFISVIQDRRKMTFLFFSSIFIACNWLLFIWAVNHGFMLETSLGYYINPLINIILGIVFLNEKLRRNQCLAVGIMCIAVIFEVINYGAFPWIALVLAMSFGLYGLLRKKIAVDSQTGLLIETCLLLIPALIYWHVFLHSEYSDLTRNTWQINSWLLLAGPFTSIPLMFFAAAAQRLNYSTLGFFQYISPSIVLLLAVFVYQEPLPFHKLMTFIMIWGALVILSIDGVIQRGRVKPKAV